MINWIQYRLDFRHWGDSIQFTGEKGLGRVSLIACILSSILTVHVCLCSVILLDKVGFAKLAIFDTASNTFLSRDRMSILLQWIIYAIFLCMFHLLEFFVTALYNPSVVNASSFVVNHSKSYTIAMLISWSELVIRFFFCPFINSTLLSVLGFSLVVIGQATRSLAMITCGESFNHIIQHSKKKNHVLVQTGIYRYLRHPSYFGFYYWSIGTQLVLGNFISTILFTIASWMFFHRRIPFEEQTLLKLFPEEYPDYKSKTIIGIPFVKMVNKTNNKGD